MNHRCAIIFVLVGCLLGAQPASASSWPAMSSPTVWPWTTLPQSSAVEGNLPINLIGENTTKLGDATYLTATLASGSTLPVTYTMEFGDQSPAETGVWSTNSTLTFSHIYTAAASYTVILNTSSGNGNASIATIMHVIDQDELQGVLTSLTAGQFVTYTFMVTNTSPTMSATHVILWGSVPANARLSNPGTTLGFTTGGDYGTGYAKSPVAVILLPGESAQISWTVEVITPGSAVITRGHAISDRSRIVVDAINRYYSLYLPDLSHADALADE